MHSMKLKPNPFEKIKNGTKKIELRLYDEKRRKIEVGDVIEFTNLETDEKIQVEVLKLHRFNNFEELYNAFPKTDLGYAEHELAFPTDMESYYNKLEIEKYGVVGIEIRLV